MSFEEAVKQYSEDDRSKANGGVLGTIRDGSDFMLGLGQVPEIVKTLLALDVNTLSDPIQSEKGFHVFKILEKTPEQLPPLEQVKQQVEARVKQRKANELQDALLQRLLQAEQVKIFDQSLMAPVKSSVTPTK